jgi:uroporphyrinogen-III synthase
MDTLAETRTLLAFDRPEALEAARRILDPADRLITLARPSIEVREVDFAKAFEAVWLVFCDPISVREVELPERLVGLLDEMNICAVGEAAAIELGKNLIHADVIPCKTDPKAVAEAIQSYGLSGSVVVFGPEVHSQAIVDALRAAGSSASSSVVYHLAFRDTAAVARTKALLVGSAIDLVLVSCDEDVLFLNQLLRDRRGGGNGPAVIALRKAFRSAHESGYAPKKI